MGINSVENITVNPLTTTDRPMSASSKYPQLQAYNEYNWGEPTQEEIDASTRYVTELMFQEEQIRVPELFAPEHKGIIYRTERNGIVSAVIHTPQMPGEILSENEQLAIRRFLFAQYVNPRIGGSSSYYDPLTAMRYNLNAESSSFFNQGDIHAVIGTPDGQVLGYLGVKGSFPEGVSIAAPESVPMSHVLRVFKQENGDSPYLTQDQIRDVDGNRVREMRKFVIRQSLLSGLNIQGALVSAELVLSLINITDQFRDSTTLIIGDTDPEVTKKNFDLFGIPVTFVEDVQAKPENLQPPYNMLWKTRYEGRNVKPFMLWIDEVNGKAHAIMQLVGGMLNAQTSAKTLFSTLRRMKDTPTITNSPVPIEA